MRTRALSVLSLALLLAACGGKDDQETASDTAESERATATAIAPSNTSQTTNDASDWVGIWYTIDKVPPTHSNVLHVVLNGRLKLVDAGNGEYAVETDKYNGTQEWPDGWKYVRLKFNETGTVYCAPLPDSAPLRKMDVDAYATYMRESDKKRFASKSPVDLHAANACPNPQDCQHKHNIVICPVDPKQTQVKEIHVETYLTGGGHDGISHGTQ